MHHEGESIQFQLNKAETYAKKHGYVIVTQYIDNPASGLKSGASMNLLIEDAGKNDFDILLVKDEFRLARSAPIFFGTMEALKKAKVKVIFLDHPAWTESRVQSLMQWGWSRRVGRPKRLDFLRG
jgi:DNA invertase Pin-like site-specific DNA recombinase